MNARPDLEMSATTTETSATLTFVNRKSDNTTYRAEHGSVDDKTLGHAEYMMHNKLPHENFIRPFNKKPQEAPTKTSTPMFEQIGFAEFDSAFASMSHMAFGQHLPIELRPDDIHLLIIQGLANFFKNYAEDFRASAVSFAGKKTLTVYLSGITDQESWNQMPHGFARVIREMIDSQQTADLILQDYSQTTETDRTVKAITLMGTFSAYFHYISRSLCYIPKFILQGTQEDWRKLQTLPQQLIEALHLTACPIDQSANGPQYLHRWLTRLQPVLDGFYQGRCGITNGEFWNNFYKFESTSGTNNVTGNIIYFYPFLKTEDQKADMCLNKWIMGKDVLLTATKGPLSKELTANFVDVDFTLKLSENEEYDMGMKAGIVAYKYKHYDALNPARRLVASHVDFSIFYKSKVARRSNNPEESTANAQTSNTQDMISTTAPADTIPATPVVPYAPSTNPNVDNADKKPIPAKRKIRFELDLDDDAPTPGLKR